MLPPRQQCACAPPLRYAAPYFVFIVSSPLSPFPLCPFGRAVSRNARINVGGGHFVSLCALFNEPPLLPETSHHDRLGERRGAKRVLRGTGRASAGINIVCCGNGNEFGRSLTYTGSVTVERLSECYSDHLMLMPEREGGRRRVGQPHSFSLPGPRLAFFGRKIDGPHCDLLRCERSSSTGDARKNRPRGESFTGR